MSHAKNWVENALATMPPGKFAFRADMFAPVGIAERLNRTLNSRWGDSGDDLSVPLSSRDGTLVTFFGGSGGIDTKLLQGLYEALELHPEAFALIKNDLAGRVLTVLGKNPPDLIGRMGTF